MSAVIQTTFNENDPKYRCCHVKLGAKVIGYVHLAVYVLVLASALWMEMKLSSSPFGSMVRHDPFIGWILGSIVAIAIVGLMLFGAHKENHWCIVPFLVVTAIIAVLAVLISIVVVIVVVGRSFGDKEQHAVIMHGYTTGLQSYARPASLDKGLMALGFMWLVLVLGVWSGVQIWFCNVVLGCYHFCRDKRNALKDSMAIIELSNPTEFNAGFVRQATVPTDVLSTTY